MSRLKWLLRNAGLFAVAVVVPWLLAAAAVAAIDMYRHADSARLDYLRDANRRLDSRQRELKGLLKQADFQGLYADIAEQHGADVAAATREIAALATFPPATAIRRYTYRQGEFAVAIDVADQRALEMAVRHVEERLAGPTDVVELTALKQGEGARDGGLLQATIRWRAP